MSKAHSIAGLYCRCQIMLSLSYFSYERNESLYSRTEPLFASSNALLSGKQL